MPAYLVGIVTIEDAEGFAEYAGQVPEVIARHGGRYIARGGTVEVLEGSWAPARVTLVEFPAPSAMPEEARSSHTGLGRPMSAAQLVAEGHRAACHFKDRIG